MRWRCSGCCHCAVGWFSAAAPVHSQRQNDDVADVAIVIRSVLTCEQRWWREMAPLSLVLKFHTFHISTRDEGRPWRLSAAIGHTRMMCKPVKSHLATQLCCHCSAAEIQTEPLWGRRKGGREGGRGAAPFCSLPAALSRPLPSRPGGTSFLLCSHAQGQQVFPARRPGSCLSSCSSWLYVFIYIIS